MNESLNVTDWSGNVNINDTNLAYEQFLDICMDKYNKYCPVIEQAVIKRKIDKPWMNNSLKNWSPKKTKTL